MLKYTYVKGDELMLEILKTEHEDLAKINCPDVLDIVDRFAQAKTKARKLIEDIFFGCIRL